jgi:hypothetical protein
MHNCSTAVLHCRARSPGPLLPFPRSLIIHPVLPPFQSPLPACLQVRDFVYISDKAYDRGQILAMERTMLSALDYKLTMPTSYQYLARLLKAANVHYEKPLALFVAYCAELTLIDYGCLRFSATEVAAGIMYVAMRAFNKADPYPHALSRHAHKQQEEVLHVAKEVVRILQRAPSSSLQAVCKKYSTTKFCEASTVAPPLGILDE